MKPRKAPPLVLAGLVALLGSCEDPALAPDEEQNLAASAATAGGASELTASTVSRTEIALGWRDNSTNETGFELQRSVAGAGGTFEAIARTGPNVTTYSSTGLTPGTEYCFRVRSFRTNGRKTSYSTFSNPSCATTQPPPAPAVLHVTATTTGADIDSDGYALYVMQLGCSEICRWLEPTILPPNGTISFPDLVPAEYRVEVFGDASNCYLTSPSSQTVVLEGTAEVEFDIACSRTVVAYSSSAEGNPEIYTIQSNGSGSSRLTFNPASDLEPAWSPDGSRIAFRSDRDGNSNIYVMQADGGNLVQLTSDAADEWHPTWSPDNRKIAFVSNRNGAEIYVMNADGSAQVKVTDGYDPAWSPDGQRIAFVGWRDVSGAGIYLSHLDGSGLRQITSNDAYADAQPAWSPDGTSIAFARTFHCYFEDPQGCLTDLLVVNADGSGLRHLTSAYGYPDWSSDVFPTWSPEGRKIAYMSRNLSYDDVVRILVIRADGSDNTGFLTEGFSPAWGR